MKQKKNSRKGKDKGRSEKAISAMKKIEEEIEIISSVPLDQSQNFPEETNLLAAVADSRGMNQEPEEIEREARATSRDADARSVDSEQTQLEIKSSTVLYDSSSTCSTDSVLSTKETSSFSRVSSSRIR